MMLQIQGTNTQIQINNATVYSGTRQYNQTTVTSTSYGQRNSQLRAASFLQLANNRILVQSFQQELNYKDNLWIDSGINMSTIGRSFKMIEECGRFANMTGFENKFLKNNIPIGSGLTCCVNKSNGFQFLLGLHEVPYLDINESSLSSANQSHEAGIRPSDVLHCNGRNQRLVAHIKNSEEILDTNLEVKDELPAIECSYPSGDNLHDLLRVWLTGNEVPWDPTILDEESNVVVCSCWDGKSKFDEANTNDIQEQDKINQFEDYILQMQK
eukprot:298441-Ditylum_brightwellii.AAC.1